MGELAVAIGILLFLVTTASALTFVPPLTLLSAGTWLLGVGLLFGLPTGFMYHVALYQAVKPTGNLPHDWWLHPTRAHSFIPPERRRGVYFWAGCGGFGFLLIVAGCAAAFFGGSML